MKIVISISFIFLFLLEAMAPGMDLCCELQKIPKLFTHYEAHKSCNENSFWTFLVDDYLNFDGGLTAHHDDSSHEGLPFQSNHQCCHFSVFYACYQAITLEGLDYAPQEPFGSYTFSHTSEFFDSPFQPPQV